MSKLVLDWDASFATAEDVNKASKSEGFTNLEGAFI